MHQGIASVDFDWKSLKLTIVLQAMWLTHFFLGLGWIAYCCLHSVLATRKVKMGLKTLMGGSSKFYRLVYSAFSLLGLGILISWQYYTATIILWKPSGLSFISGIILTVCGLALMIVCLQKYFTSHAGPKELITESQQPVLLKKGLHRYVRHPLYLSTFIFLWSIFLVFPYLSLLITNLIITIYTIIGIRFEERKLRNSFGETYTQYTREVPMIIPRIPWRSAIGNRQ